MIVGNAHMLSEGFTRVVEQPVDRRLAVVMGEH